MAWGKNPQVYYLNFIMRYNLHETSKRVVETYGNVGHTKDL